VKASYPEAQTPPQGGARPVSGILSNESMDQIWTLTPVWLSAGERKPFESEKYFLEISKWKFFSTLAIRVCLMDLPDCIIKTLTVNEVTIIVSEKLSFDYMAIEVNYNPTNCSPNKKIDTLRQSRHQSPELALYKSIRREIIQ